MPVQTFEWYGSSATENQLVWCSTWTIQMLFLKINYQTLSIVVWLNPLILLHDSMGKLFVSFKSLRKLFSLSNINTIKQTRYFKTVPLFVWEKMVVQYQFTDTKWRCLGLNLLISNKIEQQINFRVNHEASWKSVHKDTTF